MPKNTKGNALTNSLQQCVICIILHTPRNRDLYYYIAPTSIQHCCHNQLSCVTEFLYQVQITLTAGRLSDVIFCKDKRNN